MKKEILTLMLDALDRLEAAEANGNLGYHVGQKVTEAIETLKGQPCLAKVEFNDDEDEHELKLGEALALAHKKTEDHLIFAEQAADAMKEHDAGEETEFDPFRMEQEADEMRESVDTLLKTLRNAVEALGAK